MFRMAGVALVTGLIASGGHGRAYPPAGDTIIPLRVSSVETDDAQQAVSFVLENTAAKTITAWNVRVQVGTRVGVTGVDAYRGFAGLYQPASHIVPGGRLPVKLPIPATTVARAPRTAITPTGAIFADKSSVGDAMFIESVFQSRAAQRTAWRQVLRAFENAKAQRGPLVEALEGALGKIDSIPHDDVGDQVRASARANLQEVAAAARGGDSHAPSLLDVLLLRARQSLAAADAHAR